MNHSSREQKLQRPEPRLKINWVCFCLSSWLHISDPDNWCHGAGSELVQFTEIKLKDFCRAEAEESVETLEMNIQILRFRLKVTPHRKVC